MNDLRTAAQQALEALLAVKNHGWDEDTHAGRALITALKAVLAEPTLQTCNCRWDGEVQVQQCTLHEAHVDAIHEWAERAKKAEKKLAALAEPVQEPYCHVYEYDDVFGLHREFYPRKYNGRKPDRTVPLFTAPPQRKPLTDAQADQIISGLQTCHHQSSKREFLKVWLRDWAAHGIKEEK